jgi:hypothetical protein
MESSENILSALAVRARGSTDRALVAECLGASIGVLIVVVAHQHWLLALPFVVLATFACWGMVDHFTRRNILRLSRDSRLILRGVQKSIAAIGVIAAMAVVFVFFGEVLGVFVS